MTVRIYSPRSGKVGRRNVPAFKSLASYVALKAVLVTETLLLLTGEAIGLGDGKFCFGNVVKVFAGGDIAPLNAFLTGQQGQQVAALFAPEHHLIIDPVAVLGNLQGRASITLRRARERKVERQGATFAADLQLRLNRALSTVRVRIGINQFPGPATAQ